tara:strand:- start:250 stop:1407 length:1158 start_codon:yes stop_codon:yes gene_type:complete
MAEITTSQIGNGTTAYGADIVVKDLDLDVSNRVKDDTPVLNMCMTKKRKVNSTLPLWTDDIYRLPETQAWVEGAPVSTSQAESNSRYNLANYTQIFATTVAASGTARAVMQSGGDPQAYQEVKQLIELMFDVEQQLVRNDQVGTQYGGQTGSASGLSGNSQTGRRMGSLSSFAGTQSFNTTAGNGTVGITTNVNNATTDAAVATANTFTMNSNGTTFYTGTFTNQLFSPIIYKQLVTTAEERYNAKIRTIVAPTSLRTMLSDTFPTSRTINRVNAERGDTIQTYEGDFNYTYEIFDSWIMDQAGVSNSIYFLNEEVLQWGSLRDLGPNNEVFSNADASLDQFIMEGTLIVRNPAGVGMLNNISTSGANVTAARPSALVQRATNTY